MMGASSSLLHIIVLMREVGFLEGVLVFSGDTSTKKR